MNKLAIAVLFGLMSAQLWAEPTPKRLNSAATVLGEIMGTPDKAIPFDLMRRA